MMADHCARQAGLAPMPQFVRLGVFAIQKPAVRNIRGNPPPPISPPPAG